VHLLARAVVDAAVEDARIRSLVLELGAPLALVGRRVGKAWAIGMWGFHVGVLAIMAITFAYPLSGIAFAPFFWVEALVRRFPFVRGESIRPAPVQAA